MVAVVQQSAADSSPASPQPSSDLPDLSWNITFVDADPARESWFACWDPASPGGLFDTTHNLEPALPRQDLVVHQSAARGTTKTTVSAVRLEMAQAIDLLGPLGHRDVASRSAHAWADVIRAALAFIADGRVLPWVSPGGYDMWRVDPLGPRHTTLVAQLAEALPPEAHATPVEVAGKRGLISDPTYAVRAVCDAVADRFLRTPAAHRVGSLRLYADPRPTKAPHLRPWVKDLAAAHCASSRLVLQVHPPDDHSVESTKVSTSTNTNTDTVTDTDTVEPWTVKFQLASVLDPSLVIDAADYWHAPGEVMNRLGPQAEVTLLAGLRTLGRLVPPLETVLDEVAPTTAPLHDADLDLLLDSLDELLEHKIDVRWPADLVAPRIERRVVASAADEPGRADRTADSTANNPDDSFNDNSDGRPPLLDLKSLLAVDWEFLLDGVPLTVEELEVLGEAKRAVVPLRGKWVRLDRADRERLRARAPNLTMGDLLAAALNPASGTSHADGLGLTIEINPGDVAAGVAAGDGSNGEQDELAERCGLRIEGGLSTLIERLNILGGRHLQDNSSGQFPQPAGLQAELRPYQRQGLAWMAELYSLGVGGCLADDMGLGKTVQVLALHALIHQAGSDLASQADSAPTLVICPTSLLTNWAREAERFLPGVPVRIYHGASRSLAGLKPDELVITSYGVVRSDPDDLADTDFGLVVADEAQQAKNPRSSTARALRKLNGRIRLALTGTPVENRLSELWAIFDWAVPGLLGPLATFRRTTAVPIERDGDEDVTIRLARLLSPFLLRRRKSDPGLVDDLPDKIERDVVVALSPEQASLYKATVEETLVEVAEADGMQRRGMVLALLTKLKQITNHPALYLKESLYLDKPAGDTERNTGSTSETQADGSTATMAGRSGKLEALDDLLAAARANDESSLIFTQYVGMGHMLVEHLQRSGIKAALLHGGLTTKARQQLVDSFQDRQLPVLVLSLKAGGTGLNLTAATTVVHFDRWWNPAVEDQATDRAYRIGQTQPVTVHRLITQGTVEDRVAELLKHKRDLADRVVGGASEAWISELDDEELAALVTLDGDAATSVGGDVL